MSTSAFELLERIWILDESKLNKTLVDALAEGKAVIHDGVAYWAEGSGKTGVIQHLPFKEATVKSVEEAIKTAQMTTVIATAASTCIILGALIIQTKYLAAKLDKYKPLSMKLPRMFTHRTLSTTWTKSPTIWAVLK